MLKEFNRIVAKQNGNKFERAGLPLLQPLLQGFSCRGEGADIKCALKHQLTAFTADRKS